MHGQVHGGKPGQGTLAHHWAALLKLHHQTGTFLSSWTFKICKILLTPTTLITMSIVLLDQPSSPTPLELRNKHSSCGPNGYLGPNAGGLFPSCFPSIVGTMGSWHPWRSVGDSLSRLGWWHGTPPTLWWTSLRPIDLSGAPINRTSCSPRSFLLTSAILLCYAYSANGANLVVAKRGFPYSVKTTFLAASCRLLSMCIHFLLFHNIFSLFDPWLLCDPSFLDFGMFYLFASHFIDEYYTVHSFGDHVALGAPAAILFCASASCPASNVIQPWRIYPCQPYPIDPHPRTLRNRMQPWRRCRRQLQRALPPALLSQERKWSLLHTWTKVHQHCFKPARLPPPQALLHWTDGPYYHFQDLHIQWRSPWTMCQRGEQQWLQLAPWTWGFSFFGSLETKKWLPSWLLASFLWSTPSTWRFSFCWFFPEPMSDYYLIIYFDGSRTGIPADPLALRPIWVMHIVCGSCLHDHQRHSCWPTTGPCPRTSHFGILALYRFWDFWGSHINSFESDHTLFRKRKNPADAGCVCVRNIWTDVKLLLLTQLILAWGQCTTDKHCTTKTLSARGDMESDQLHVPANHFNYFTGNGKRPSQEPQSWILFLHGCRNLRLFSASFPTLFTRYFTDMAKG